MRLLLYILAMILVLGYSRNAVSQNVTVEYRIVATRKSDSSIVSYSNEVLANPSLNLLVPTVFTPNGDGLNDAFGPLGKEIQEMNMTIFNEWGEIVFVSENVSEKWNGSFKGEIAPSGNYAYQIVVKDFRGRSLSKSGIVTLIKG